MTSSSRTALIVGAGIGGLAAAIALRQSGWNVRVFEQAETARELGFGVGVAPNAVAALRELGVADTVLNRGFEPARVEFRRPDGTVLKRAEIPRGTFGGPMLVALRPALHGALLEALGPAALQLGAKVVGFTETSVGVRLNLTDGAQVQGDLLVGADGVGSVIRRILHPAEPPPRHSGIVAVRGGIDGALHHLNGRHAIYYLGRGIESIFVRASDTGMYWFLSLAVAIAPTTRDPRAFVAAMAPQFDGAFRAITSITEELRLDELYDRDALPSWSKGRVTLVGDAAHPVLPHTAQGAAQALIDGVTLGRLLRDTTDVESTLRTYENERRPTTTALLNQGRRTARLMAATNPMLCHLRELGLRATPLTTIARLRAKTHRAGQ